MLNIIYIYIYLEVLQGRSSFVLLVSLSLAFIIAFLQRLHMTQRSVLYIMYKKKESIKSTQRMRLIVIC